MDPPPAPLSPPSPPQVEVEVKLLDDNETLQFFVRNRAKRGREPLQKWTGDGRAPAPVSNRPAATTSLSDGIGLSHISTAARVIDMAVALWQEDDTVIFSARMDGSVVTSPRNGPAATAPENIVFPRGLRIACIDDNGIARQSLSRMLGAKFPDSVVTVYGETVDSVEAFKDALLDGCDIAVLDQNLDIPGAGDELLGTDVLKAAVARGYDGLAFVRSGNVSAADQQLYYESGAHGVYDKAMPLKQLAGELAKEYARLMGDQN